MFRMFSFLRCCFFFLVLCVLLFYWSFVTPNGYDCVLRLLPLLLVFTMFFLPFGSKFCIVHSNSLTYIYNERIHQNIHSNSIQAANVHGVLCLVALEKRINFENRKKIWSERELATLHLICSASIWFHSSLRHPFRHWNRWCSENTGKMLVCVCVCVILYHLAFSMQFKPTTSIALLLIAHAFPTVKLYIHLCSTLYPSHLVMMKKTNWIDALR